MSLRVPTRGSCSFGDLIKKCAVDEWGLTLCPFSPQVLLSCLTLIEPRFSESLALMENKFHWIRMEPLTSPFSGPKAFALKHTHSSQFYQEAASFYLGGRYICPTLPASACCLLPPGRAELLGNSRKDKGTGEGSPMVLLLISWWQEPQHHLGVLSHD